MITLNENTPYVNIEILNICKRYVNFLLTLVGKSEGPEENLPALLNEKT